MAVFRRLTIGLLLFLALSGEAFAQKYPDVPGYHKHAEAINALTGDGTVQGYPEGMFYPDGLINRAEAVKILTKSNFPVTEIETALGWHWKAAHSFVNFPDVPIWEWYSKYVEVSFQHQVIQGYPDGYFRPANNINFAEALKVILETYKVDMSRNRYQSNKLLYVQQGEWFEKYFTYAYAHNLISQNKFYHPGQLITRGEFVEIIYRLETNLKTGQFSFKENRVATSSEYRITIPKLNIVDLNVNFADAYDPSAALDVLKYGLGHYLNAPDSGKKMVLFGHSSGYSWDDSAYKTLLREIDRLSPGDRIYLNYQEKGYVYEIYKSDIIAASQDYTLIQNEHENELALYTCWPPNSIAKRYVVYAKPI